MSEKGVFAVDRGVFDHPKFSDNQPYSKREAWIWLLSAAAWKAHTRWVSGTPVALERGQLVASVRTLGKQWRWDEKKVRRFLNLLKTPSLGDAEIDADTAAGITIVTIRKYDDYQRVSLPDAAPSAAVSAAELSAAAPQQRRIKEDIKNIKSLSEGRFAEFWAEFPKRAGSNPRKPALQVYQQAVKAGHDEQVIIDGAKRYRLHQQRIGKEGTEYVAMAKTWLNQARWTDELPAAPTATTAGGRPVVDWEAKMRQYVMFPAYSRAWYGPGRPPGLPGCGVPAEIQRKYGFEPAEPVAAGEHI